MKKLFASLFILLSATAFAVGQTFSVADYGVKPDSRLNAVPAVQQAIAAAIKAGGGVVKFEKGRYDFWGQHTAQRNFHQSNTSDIFPQNIAILLENTKNITIDGQGSEFVMHGRMMPVAIDNCQDISLLNFSVDWDIPMTAQGEVLEVTPTSFDVRINILESPYVIENKRLVFVGEGWKSPVFSGMEFRKEPRIVEPQTGDVTSWGYSGYDVQKTDRADIVRFTPPSGKPMPKVGNWLVLRHSARDHAGVFCQYSKNLLLENVSIHQTAGLGVLCQYTENIKLLNSGVYPNAAKNRILSGHDDGFHLMGCRGEIRIENCRWQGLMDDPINIHGTCVQIVELLSPTKLVCRFMHAQAQGMNWGQPGNAVGFIENQTMRTIARGEIKEIKRLNVTDFEIDFTAPIPQGITTGAALENLTWTPSEVIIRNNYFGGCRARGLLISVPSKVLVENNIFESSGSAILIAGDANQWFESGAVRDVLIQGNEFRSSCMTSMYQFCQAIISIEPEIPQADARYPFHSNIRIQGNTFHPYDYPILYAKSVDGLTFSDNKIIRSYDFEPFHRRKEGITLDKCQNVSIVGNIIEGDVLGRNIKLESTLRKDVKLGRGEFFQFLK